jgi:hypothetical protein
MGVLGTFTQSRRQDPPAEDQLDLVWSAWVSYALLR